MNPLRVVEIVRRMEQGRTLPFLVRTEDDRLYVAKGRSATAAGLAAEWVCAHLGVAAGLPIPPFALLDVPKELVEAFGAEAAELGAGIAFGSLLQGAVQELPAGRVARIGVELRRRLLAFDWWVENADRTLSERGGNPNLLWSEAGGGLWVIDHNLAFDAQFDEQALRMCSAPRLTHWPATGSSGKTRPGYCVQPCRHSTRRWRTCPIRGIGSTPKQPCRLG